MGIPSEQIKQELLISKKVVRIIKKEFMSEWSSESDEYNGEEVKQAEDPTEPIVTDKDIALGKRTLRQVFNNTYHQKIKARQRRKREVFSYGVDNKMQHQRAFRKVKRKHDTCLKKQVLELYKSTHLDCWAVAEHISAEWNQIDVCVYNVYHHNFDFDENKKIANYVQISFARQENLSMNEESKRDTTQWTKPQ